MTDPSKYKLNHTMLRVKDPKRTMAFYVDTLGMTQVNKSANPDNKYDLYYLAYDHSQSPSHGKHWTDRQGIIELTHNYGTENDANYKVHNGNQDPQGFGHVAISVDNIQAACQRIEDAGYKFQKKLSDGKMRSIAFALDPDGYWVEIIPQKPVEETENVKTTDVSAYRMNHTMIRVKDPEVSLKFYQEVMGMGLKRTSENKDAGFNLYFLGYGAPAPEKSANGVNPVADREGILELTWNHGSEKKSGKIYHDGNAEPQGFGHICVSVDDLQAACDRFDKHGVEWKKRLTDGRMKNIAFVLDPDGYWIEVVQNQNYKDGGL